MTRILSILGTVLVVGVAAALGIYWLVSPGPPVLRLSGVVESHEVRLSSKVGGRIRKIAIREGDIVQAGTPLVYFDVPELEARREQVVAALEAAHAQLAKANNGPRAEEKAAARAAADAARARLKRLQVGYREEEIAMALADSKSAQVELDRSQKEWDREVRLQKGNATTAAQSEATFAGFSQFQEKARGLQTRWKMLVAGYRPEEIAEAAAELARAQALADLLEQGTRPEEIAEAKARVAEQYAKVRELDVQLQEAVVVAPSTARVEVVPFRKGDTVAANQAVVRILLAEDLFIKAYVPEPNLGQVKVGQEVKIAIDSFPGRAFRGEVVNIAGISEFCPRNIQTADERCHQVFAFKVRLLESQCVFKSGTAAEVILPLNPNPVN